MSQTSVITAFNFLRVTSEIQVNLHRHTLVKLIVIGTLNHISRVWFRLLPVVFYVVAVLIFCFNHAYARIKNSFGPTSLEYRLRKRTVMRNFKIRDLSDSVESRSAVSDMVNVNAIERFRD